MMKRLGYALGMGLAGVALLLPGLVLDGAGDQTSLWEVPVDGQPATQLPGVLPGAISITANNARNALVVGMTQNRMEVSAGLAGPWQPLGTGGQSPAFQAPAIPITPEP